MKTFLVSWPRVCISAMLATLLSACGGGSVPTQQSGEVAGQPKASSSEPVALAQGIAPSALKADFGVPQSPEKVAAMAKTVGTYFAGRKIGTDIPATKSVATTKAAPYPQPVFRLRSNRTGVHFYTISTEERDATLANFPWFYSEGTGYWGQQAQAPTLSPVYRFYNPVSGTHFYTIDEAEKDDVIARLSAIYTLDGVGMWASHTSAPGWVPNHRFFNRATGTHFYTADEGERQSVVANNPEMQYDGVGFYVRNTSDPLLTGVVAVNGPVRNAVVCLDLNLNGVCNDGELSSARTGTDGVYSVSFRRGQLTEAAQAAAPLIARMVPGPFNDPNTTIDQADGQEVTETAYLMRQVPGKTGAINPLTTLVAAGVTGIVGGMTEADSRGNVAIQLGIAQSKIDNYQDDPAFSSAVVVDNARTMAMITADALEQGIVLEVGDQTRAVMAEQGDLRNLWFTSTGNLTYLDYSFTAKAAGIPGISLLDRRLTFSAGTQINADDYNQAYLTPAGWLRCDFATPITATLGVPNRSTFCNAQNAVGFRKYESIAGRSMGAVVTELQSDPLNFINTNGLPTGNLLTALGSAQFPSASSLRLGTSLNLNLPIYIDRINADGRPQEQATTLEALIASRPASGVNLSNGFGALSLGPSSGNTRILRVAFTGITNATSGTVQFYECDFDGENFSNCATTTSGTYAIEVVHGARVMRFAGHADTLSNNVRLYVEVKANHQANNVIGSGDWVFVARQRKLGVNSNWSENKRLNGVGWAAMKAQLGL